MFSFVKIPDNELAERDVYIKTTETIAIDENLNEFEHTFQEINKYCK